MVSIEKHERTVQQAGSHMDLAEHVTWMLGDVVEPVDYPMEVTVTIEARDVSDSGGENDG